MDVHSPHPFAEVAVTDAELAAGSLAPDRHSAVVASLRDLGAAVITRATDPAHCDELRRVMLADLPHATTFAAALDIPGHVQHTPPPRGEHLHRDIAANAIAMSVVRALVGDVQLALYTGNTMLGGTTQQQPVHWDYPQLWADADVALPPASITVNIALEDVTVENGALEVWPGTHHDPRSGAQHALEAYLAPLGWVDERRHAVPPVQVPLAKGALLVRDGRMWHRGTTNSTAEPRVMVAASYHARWFRPAVIDFYEGAQDAVRALGVPVTARYRADFDHQVWPPNGELVPKPL